MTRKSTDESKKKSVKKEVWLWLFFVCEGSFGSMIFPYHFVFRYFSGPVIGGFT